MKIMVLGIRGMPDVSGGVETHAEELYRRLADLGCDVEVIVRSPFVSAGRKFFGPIRLRRIWSPRTSGFEALVHSALGAIYASFKRPDILHIHAVGPAIVAPIARLFGLRVVVTHHGPDYDRDKWGAFARRVLILGECAGMRYSHARIAISKGIVDLIQNKYALDSDLIPNGVSAAQIQSSTDQLSRFGLEVGRYFLQVSRIVPEKRQLDLIQAYADAKHGGWKLVLVGGAGADEYSRKVEAAAKAAGAVLTGIQRGPALQQLYTHAGAFILPSSHEGLPIALLEALSYGLPALASDIPANLEVELGADNYFPLGDCKALAEKLTQLAHAAPNLEQRAVRKNWVMHRYDWNRVAEQTLGTYRRILKR